MRLAKISTYRRTFFAPGDAPSPAAVIAQIKAGDLPGQQRGRLWYVDLDELDRRHGIRASLDQRERELIEGGELEGLV